MIFKHDIVRSEEVADILSAPPSILLRVGSMTIGGILLVALIGCFIFRYPEVITCEVTITNVNPPVLLVAKTTGRLKELRVADGGWVAKDGIIAVLENPARTTDVMLLDSMISQTAVGEGRFSEIEEKEMRLGTIQASYGVWLKALADYLSFINNNLYDQRIQAEESKLKPYADYMSSMLKQKRITDKLNQLSRNDYQRETTLHNKGLTATVNMENAEQTLLNSDMQIEQMQMSIANTQIQIAQVRNSIAELKLQKEQERRQFATALLTAQENVRNEIAAWKQNYVLQSPIEGVVSYNSLWNVNQNVNVGEQAFSVVSRNRGELVGKVLLPITGSGKVKPGQRVNIKLHGFPYLEYGFLTAWVVAVSSMPEENRYTVTISLDSNMKTSYGKQIDHVGDLMGEAEIITEDLTVAERLIAPLRYWWKRSQ